MSCPRTPKSCKKKPQSSCKCHMMGGKHPQVTNGSNNSVGLFQFGARAHRHPAFSSTSHQPNTSPETEFICGGKQQHRADAHILHSTMVQSRAQYWQGHDTHCNISWHRERYIFSISSLVYRLSLRDIHSWQLMQTSVGRLIAKSRRWNCITDPCCS